MMRLKVHYIDMAAALRTDARRLLRAPKGSDTQMAAREIRVGILRDAAELYDQLAAAEPA